MPNQLTQRATLTLPRTSGRPFAIPDAMPANWRPADMSARVRARSRAIAPVLRRLQIALGLIWLVDGILQLQPYMFGKTFVTGVIDPNAAGQPWFIGDLIKWIGSVILPHVALFNGFAAAIQILIGVGLLYRPTVKMALLVSFGWALGIWFTGEGFGMLLTGTANPLTGAPGAVVLYVLAGLICWPVLPKAVAASDQRPRLQGLLAERSARFAWAALWLGSCILWLLPSNRTANATYDALMTAPSGANWLTTIQHRVAQVTAGHGLAIALTMAASSAAIGTSALSGWHRKPFLIAAATIAAAYWVLGQGLGGVFTGQATDPNTGPLLIILAAVFYSAKSRPARVYSDAESKVDTNELPGRSDKPRRRTGAQSNFPADATREGR